MRSLLIAAPLAWLFGGLSSPGVGWGDEIINFTSLDRAHELEARGALVMPDDPHGKVPVVIIVHSTGGIDGTGAFYRGALNAAGLATFEVDFKTGIFQSSLDRPDPDAFLPLGLSALKTLKANPAIDSDKIGILGFSLGAILAISAMDVGVRSRWLGADAGFAAYAAVYPDCRYLSRTLSGKTLQQAPLIVFHGSLDSYGAAKYCPILESDLSGRVDPPPTFVMYPGVHHGFDRPGKPSSYADPMALNGVGRVEFNERAANDARAKVVAFFSKWLGEGDR